MLPVFPGRHAVEFSKIAVEKRNVIVARGKGYFDDRHLRSLKQTAGIPDTNAVDKRENRHTRVFFENSGKKARIEPTEASQGGEGEPFGIVGADVPYNLLDRGGSIRGYGRANARQAPLDKQGKLLQLEANHPIVAAAPILIFLQHLCQNGLHTRDELFGQTPALNSLGIEWSRLFQYDAVEADLPEPAKGRYPQLVPPPGGR